jgi:hypothetical protein
LLSLAQAIAPDTSAIPVSANFQSSCPPTSLTDIPLSMELRDLSARTRIPPIAGHAVILEATEISLPRSKTQEQSVPQLMLQGSDGQAMRTALAAAGSCDVSEQSIGACPSFPVTLPARRFRSGLRRVDKLPASYAAGPWITQVRTGKREPGVTCGELRSEARTDSLEREECIHDSMDATPRLRTRLRRLQSMAPSNLLAETADERLPADHCHVATHSQEMKRNVESSEKTGASNTDSGCAPGKRSVDCIPSSVVDHEAMGMPTLRLVTSLRTTCPSNLCEQPTCDGNVFLCEATQAQKKLVTSIRPAPDATPSVQGALILASDSIHNPTSTSRLRSSKLLVAQPMSVPRRRRQCTQKTGQQNTEQAERQQRQLIPSSQALTNSNRSTSVTVVRGERPASPNLLDSDSDTPSSITASVRCSAAHEASLEEHALLVSMQNRAKGGRQMRSYTRKAKSRRVLDSTDSSEEL